MLREFESFESEAQAKRNVVEAIKAVAERLGNTHSLNYDFVSGKTHDGRTVRESLLASRAMMEQRKGDRGVGRCDGHEGCSVAYPFRQWPGVRR
jgi:hypothetical protein